MMYDNIIEIAPLAFMRGRTFKDCIIIGDEMQNSTPSQMLMLLTRMGKDSKMIITGDAKQNDMTSKKSGLVDIVDKTQKYMNFIKTKYGCYTDKSIQLIEFTNKDIERSKIVKRVLDIYNIDLIIDTMKKKDENNDTSVEQKILELPRKDYHKKIGPNLTMDEENNIFEEKFNEWKETNHTGWSN